MAALRMSEAGEPMTKRPAEMDEQELAAAFEVIAAAVTRAPADSPCKQVRLRVCDAVLDELNRRRQEATCPSTSTS